MARPPHEAVRIKRLEIRLTDKERKALERGAERENRSYTNYIVTLILRADEARERGKEPKP